MWVSRGFALLVAADARCVSGHPASSYLLSELDDQRQLVGLDKRQQLLFGELPVEGIAALVEL